MSHHINARISFRFSVSFFLCISSISTCKPHPFLHKLTNIITTDSKIQTPSHTVGPAPSPSCSTWAPTPPESQPRTCHSTYTTLLLDDSPIKVLLQPCSHVCIREYGEALTGLDLTLPVIAKFTPKPDWPLDDPAYANICTPVGSVDGNRWGI